MKRFSALVLCAATGLLAFVTAGRAETVVTIKSLEGDVSISRMVDGTNSAKMNKAVAGMTLNPGDEVHTGFDSKAVLAFADNSEISIDPISQFRIKGFEKNGDTYTTRVQMRIGGMTADVKSGDFQSDFQVDSPNSTTAVEGTGLKLKTDPQGDRHKGLSGRYIAVFPRGNRFFYMTKNSRGLISRGNLFLSKNNRVLRLLAGRASDKPLVGLSKEEQKVVEMYNRRRRLPWNPTQPDPTNPISQKIRKESVVKAIISNPRNSGVSGLNPASGGGSTPGGGTTPPPWPGLPGGGTGGSTGGGTPPPFPGLPGGGAGGPTGNAGGSTPNPPGWPGGDAD